MGDGAGKTVGLSLAEQPLVFPLHRLVGRVLDYAHSSTRFQPCFLDLPHVFFSLEP